MVRRGSGPRILEKRLGARYRERSSSRARDAGYRKPGWNEQIAKGWPGQSVSVESNESYEAQAAGPGEEGHS